MPSKILKSTRRQITLQASPGSTGRDVELGPRSRGNKAGPQPNIGQKANRDANTCWTAPTSNTPPLQEYGGTIP